MGQAVAFLADVMVSPGFEGKPQATFTPSERNAAFGIVRCRVSNMRKKKEETNYDNFTIEWYDAPAGVIELLNQKNVRVAVHGDISHETMNNHPFTRVTARGMGALVITKYGEKVGEAVREEKRAEVREEL